MAKKKKKKLIIGLAVGLVVVIIIAVLAGLIAPQVFQHLVRTKQNVAKSNIATLETTVESFSLTYGRLPESLDDLVERPADILEEKWQGPMLKSKDLLDPWERRYVYKQPGDNGPYDLYSLGKDGQEGGEGEDADIVNW